MKMNEHQDDQDSGEELKKVGDLEDGDHEDEGEERRERDTGEMEVEVGGEVKSQGRVCPFCNKTFVSGKAFGGHMSSAHVQAKGSKKIKYCSQRSMKRKSSNKPGKPAGGVATVNAESDESGESDEDGGYNCLERLDSKMEKDKGKFENGCRCCCCNKDFPSKKSLFGHMRCHPNRPYRGMTPPNFRYDIKNSENPKNGVFVNGKYNIKKSGNQGNGVVGNGKYGIMKSGNSKNGVVGNGKYDIKNSGNQGNGVVGNGMMDVPAGTSADGAARWGGLAQHLVGTGWLGKDRSLPCSSSDTSFPMVKKSDSRGNNEMCDKDHSPEERCMANLLMHLHTSGGQKSNLDDERVVKGETGSATGKVLRLSVNSAMSKKAAEENGQSSNGVGAKSAGVTDQLKNETKCETIFENGKDDDSSDATKTDDELVEKLNNDRKGKVKTVVEKKNNAEEIVMRKVRIASSSARDASASVGAPPPPTPPPQPPQNAGENVKEFRCTECGKIFTTHQALGGHRSSHNKFKMNIHNTEDAPAAASAAASAAAMEDKNGDREKLICDEIPSAAKGKRSSKKRSKAAPEVEKVLKFDLNELPEEEG